MSKRVIMTMALLGAGAISAKMFLSLVGRKVLDRAIDKTAKTLMKDLYDENVWEFISNTTRIGIQNSIEIKLRSSSKGKVIKRPMGSPKKYPSFEDIMFSVAQLYTMPTHLEEKVDVSVAIGKKAARPFSINTPIMIAPMSFGEALSEKAKIALAKGAALAGTLVNSGQGPFLDSERKEAKYLIYQYHRGDWGNTPELIKQCDAVEIQFGRGAFRGEGHILAEITDKELIEAHNYPVGKEVVMPSQQREIKQPKDLKPLVNRLREEAQGAPVGVKLVAGKFLEADLEIVCQAGVDFISIDGAEAGVRSSPPILQDDFGIPLMFAIRRAAVWLEKNNYKDSISLFAGGRIRTPGDVLKACAMGADAVYIGVTALLAMSNTQIMKSLPFEPPTQLLWFNGKQSSKLNVNEGANSLYSFLESSKKEIIEGTRALGKASIKDVTISDLVTTNEMISKAMGIPMIYEPFITK